MGSVTFNIPLDLARMLCVQGALTSAVETGTYLGDTALMLSEFVDDVWSIELVPEIYDEARVRTAHRPNVHLSQGFSPDVLPQILQLVPGPALYWLDGHGGTFGPNDLPDFKECPVEDEIRAIERHGDAHRSCILIDDARAFFGPMPQHRPSEWPSFVEVADLLRASADRYVTALDDVIIAVPPDLRHVVDAWWLKKMHERKGMEWWQYEYKRARQPRRVDAFKALVRSVAPRAVVHRYEAWMARRG